ncbi:MAG: hypothetical protein V7L29_25055 [Nostoc sp.]|uniref:hypothetical protein n=1 Tax=Nostoc sp. TaxID=1180 RepID=UPI002FF66F92
MLASPVTLSTRTSGTLVKNLLLLQISPFNICSNAEVGSDGEQPSDTRRKVRVNLARFYVVYTRCFTWYGGIQHDRERPLQTASKEKRSHLSHLPHFCN